MGNLVQNFEEHYQIGNAIFLKLFQLKKDDLIKVMSDMFSDSKRVLDIFENNPTVIKTLRDDEPDTIEIYCYDKLEISWWGVKYKPEHGQSTTIIKFNKFFNVDTIK
jgi:hypothetical protein